MAGKGIVWRIDIPKLNALKRRLKPAEDLYAEPWRDAMHGLAADVEGIARAAAPVRTGALRASITAKAAKTKVPLSIRTRVRAKSPRGFPYPKVLEFSNKHHHFRWLRDAMKAALGKVNARLNTAAKAIEGKWT